MLYIFMPLFIMSNDQDLQLVTSADSSQATGASTVTLPRASICFH